MKTLLALLLNFTIAFSLLATIHTVDNKENSGADFTDLQAAIDAAVAGDTIYVSGSPVSYGSITINKQLVLFGQGYKPNNQFGSRTEINNVNFDFVVFPSSDPSGSHLEGFLITSIINIQDSEFELNNITISRNYIDNRILIDQGAYDIIIEHNIIDSYLDFGGADCNGSDPCSTNIIVRNNIFDYNQEPIFNSRSNTHLVTNNIFLATSGDFVGSCVSTIISNNIIIGVGVGTTTNDCDFCTFTNNISFGPNATDFDYGTNTTGSNLEATDPLFVDAPADFNFDESELLHDFRLLDGSPAIGAGSDGTDIGIFGGARPFPISETAEGYAISPFPTLPQVLEMNILNATIPEDGTLNVEFKAKKVD